MNFFLPGLGYVYIGMGRDGKTLFFGLLILLAVALTFYVGVIGDAISPRDIPSLPAWEETFGLLGLLTPIAFAYDGYHRAQSA